MRKKGLEDLITDIILSGHQFESDTTLTIRIRKITDKEDKKGVEIFVSYFKEIKESHEQTLDQRRRKRRSIIKPDVEIDDNKENPKINNSFLCCFRSF